MLPIRFQENSTFLYNFKTELVLTHLKEETLAAALCCQTTGILDNMLHSEKKVNK